MQVIRRVRGVSVVFLLVWLGLAGAQDVVRAQQLSLEDLPLIFLPVSRARKLSVVPAVPRRFTVSPMRPLPFQAAGEASAEGREAAGRVLGGTSSPTTRQGGAQVIPAPFSTSVVTTSSSTSFSPPSPSPSTSPPVETSGAVTKVLVTPATRHPNHLRGPGAAAPTPAFFSKPTIRRGSTIATIRFRVPDRKPSRSLDGQDGVFPALIGFVHRPSRRSTKEADAHAFGGRLLSSPIGLLYGLW